MAKATRKRVLSLLMTLVLAFSLLPVSALAVGEDPEEPDFSLTVDETKKFWLPTNEYHNPYSGHTETWASSDENVATVTKTDYGDYDYITITAIGAGTATITHTYWQWWRGNFKQNTVTRSVKVTAPAVTISGSSSVEVGESINLTATPSNISGSPTYAWSYTTTDTGAVSFTDSSSNPVTVTGVTEGTATITVTASNSYGQSATDTFDVTVTANKINVAVNSNDPCNLNYSDAFWGKTGVNTMKVVYVDTNGNRLTPNRSSDFSISEVSGEVAIDANTFAADAPSGYDFQGAYICFDAKSYANSGSRMPITALRNVGEYQLSDGRGPSGAYYYDTYLQFSDGTNWYAYNPTGTLYLVYTPPVTKYTVTYDWADGSDLPSDADSLLPPPVSVVEHGDYTVVAAPTSHTSKNSVPGNWTCTWDQTGTITDITAPVTITGTWTFTQDFAGSTNTTCTVTKTWDDGTVPSDYTRPGSVTVTLTPTSGSPISVPLTESNETTPDGNVWETTVPVDRNTTYTVTESGIDSSMYTVTPSYTRESISNVSVIDTVNSCSTKDFLKDEAPQFIVIKKAALILFGPLVISAGIQLPEIPS